MFSKVYHAVFYGGFACMVWLSMRRPSVSVAAFVTMWAGGLDEIHQYFVPFRHARLTDVAIDVTAGLVAATILSQLRTRARVKALAR